MAVCGVSCLDDTLLAERGILCMVVVVTEMSRTNAFVGALNRLQYGKGSRIMTYSWMLCACFAVGNEEDQLVKSVECFVRRKRKVRKYDRKIREVRYWHEYCALKNSCVDVFCVFVDASTGQRLLKERTLGRHFQILLTLSFLQCIHIIEENTQ